MDGCDICYKMKNRTEAPVEKLKLSKILEKLWIHLMVDFITKLLLVAGKDAILVVYNKLSKIVATTKRTLVKGLARLFRDNIWKLHGLPESVVLDKGPQFIVELTRKLNKMLETEMKLLTSFYSQKNGQIKGMNQELE